MNALRRLSVCLICISFLRTNIAAQPADSITNVTTDQDLWILIVPGIISPSAEGLLESQLADIVSDVAWQTGRFEVFTRYDAREFLPNYRGTTGRMLRLDDIYTAADSLLCDETLIVELRRFKQVGVPPAEDEDEEDTGFFQQLIDGLLSSDDDYSDNIYSQLSVRLINGNAVTRKEIDRFEIDVSYTGGDKAESKKEVIKQFRTAVRNELHLMYQLVSEVLQVDGAALSLRLGRNLGLAKHTQFEITQPDIIRTKDSLTTFYPGKTVGLASVHSVADTAAQALIIRQWEPVQSGFYAYEYNKTIHGISLFVQPNFPNNNFRLGGEFQYSPLAAHDFGGHLHYMFVTDSYENQDHGFGFGAYGALRVFASTALTLRLRIDADLNVPFRKDDDGRTVNTGLLSAAIAASVSFPFGKRTDLVFNLGYRASTRSSAWNYSEDDETYDAFWNDTPPEVDISGLFMTVGYRWLLF
jgi:hypothetical protein